MVLVGPTFTSSARFLSGGLSVNTTLPSASTVR